MKEKLNFHGNKLNNYRVVEPVREYVDLLRLGAEFVFVLELLLEPVVEVRVLTTRAARTSVCTPREAVAVRERLLTPVNVTLTRS